MTYPEIVDAPTKDLIFDWFQYREVCDNDKFNTFFNRTLNASMRKYKQLLRIQPGEIVLFEDGVSRTVTYDWLVETYRELQSIGIEEGVLTETSDGQIAIGREGSKTLSSTSTMTGTDITDRDRTTSDTESGSSATTTADETARASATANSDTQTRNLAGTSSTSDKHDSQNDVVHQNLGKAAPQSVSYAGSSGFPNAFDWTYPGSQEEDRTTTIDDTTDASGTATTDTGTISSASNGSVSDSAISNGAAATSTEKTGSGTDNEDVTFATARQTTDGSTEGYTDGETHTNTGSKANMSSRDTDNREREQGRTTSIAELLQGAKDFILGSSAWDYLYSQLDKCFMAIYN